MTEKIEPGKELEDILRDFPPTEEIFEYKGPVRDGTKEEEQIVAQVCRNSDKKIVYVVPDTTKWLNQSVDISQKY